MRMSLEREREQEEDSITKGPNTRGLLDGATKGMSTRGLDYF